MIEELKRPPAQPFAPRRPKRRPSDYLTTEVAIMLSILLHLLALMTWQYRGELARFPLFKPLAKWWQSAPRPTARPAPTPTITFLEAPAEVKPPVKPERSFMETDASQETGAKPKDARFYSDRSTVAANLKNPTQKTGETPYLEGKDTRMKSTENVIPGAGAPAAPPPRPATPPHPAVPPKPVESPKPATPKAAEPPKKLPDEGFKVVEVTKVAELEKPVAPTPVVQPAAPPVAPMPPTPSPEEGSQREIASLQSQMTASGSSRIGIAAFNVEGSPFGAYDKALIRAVQSRWYALIQQNGLYERSGSVTLHFNLLADGSVQGMATKENTAGITLGLFCEKAIVDSAPFPPLSDKLRDLIGNDPREINFTFYY